MGTIWESGSIVVDSIKKTSSGRSSKFSGFEIFEFWNLGEADINFEDAKK